MNRLEDERSEGPDRREALLATLLVAQSTFVSQRRRRRRIATTLAVALVAVAGTVALRAAWRTPTESDAASRPMLVERSSPVERSDPVEHAASVEHAGPADFESPEPTTTAVATVERVGGGTPQWIVLAPTDPEIVKRLSVTAKAEAPPIVLESAIAHTPATPNADDDALVHHLLAAGSRNGLLRINGRVLLMTPQHDAPNGG